VGATVILTLRQTLVLLVDPEDRAGVALEALVLLEALGRLVLGIVAGQELQAVAKDQAAAVALEQ
jgi:hypothetical protein